MIELFILPGSSTYDLPSLDFDSLIAASYLQLLRPGQFSINYSGLTDGLPHLKQDGLDYPFSSFLSLLLPSSEKESPQAIAFHALLNSSLRPMILHSLFSLPKNWQFLRPLLAEPLPTPQRFYVPAQLRESARSLVPDEWWGLGGEIEKEEEEERRRKRVLLEGKYEQLQEAERRERKDKIKKTFGVSKISAEAHRILTQLESTLAVSTTPFFFSSPNPKPFDAHLSALLSLVLFLPLPQPILADLINSSFPHLWRHTTLLRRSLWQSKPSPPISTSTVQTPLYKIIWRDFVPSIDSLIPWFGTSSNVGSSKKKLQKKTKEQIEFGRKRTLFFAAAVGATVLWALATGAVGIPGMSNRGDDDDDEWEVVVEEDDDDEEIIE